MLPQGNVTTAHHPVIQVITAMIRTSHITLTVARYQALLIGAQPTMVPSVKTANFKLPVMMINLPYTVPRLITSHSLV